MKYWTHSSTTADLVVDMVECQECGILLPASNLELHVLHTHGGGKKKTNTTNTNTKVDDEQPAKVKAAVPETIEQNTTPQFVMETIPCEDCHVLIPKHNWEIHKAHACPGRPLRPTNEKTVTTTTTIQDEVLFPTVETVECNLCGILVPITNLELHQAHACPAREGSTAFAWTASNSSDDNEEVVSRNKKDSALPSQQQRRDRWSCPRCSLLNSELDVQCLACNYRLPGGLSQKQRKNTGGSRRRPTKNVSSNNPPPPQRRRKPRRRPQQRDKDRDEPFWKTLPSWRTVVKTVVPDNYQHYLTTSSEEGDESDKDTGRIRSTTDDKEIKPSVVVPSQQRVRGQRTGYLDRLEQERQQYLLVLARTRREQEEQQDLIAILLLSNHEEMEQPSSDIDGYAAVATSQPETTDPSSTATTPPNGSTTGDKIDVTSKSIDEDLASSLQSANVADEACIDGNSPQPESQTPSTEVSITTTLELPNGQLIDAQRHLELLQATEILCLQHLEHLRRTRVVDELRLDIRLLGLPQWQNHLEHLMLLYQSCASEQHIDVIVWELRVHFMKYAMEEMMALLELAIRKYCRDEDDFVKGKSKSSGSSVSDHASNQILQSKVCTICQGVLPFLGKPLTPALRAL